MTPEEKGLMDRIDNLLGSMHGVDREVVLEPQRAEIRQLLFYIQLGLLNPIGLAYADRIISRREKQYL
jgi:hypothetical protein